MGFLFLIFGTKPVDLLGLALCSIYIYFFLVLVVYLFMIFFVYYNLIGGNMGSSLRKNLLVDYLKEQFP